MGNRDARWVWHRLLRARSRLLVVETGLQYKVQCTNRGTYGWATLHCRAVADVHAALSWGRDPALCGMKKVGGVAWFGERSGHKKPAHRSASPLVARSTTTTSKGPRALSSTENS